MTAFYTILILYNNYIRGSIMDMSNVYSYFDYLLINVCFTMVLVTSTFNAIDLLI